MRLLITSFVLFIMNIVFSQENQKHYITDTDSISIVLKAGSCSSPDGPLTQTLIMPPNYQYLDDNGYCLYSYPITSQFTACFTFVAGSSSVDVNSGYSASCNNVQFSNFRLFNSSCVQIATGLSFSGLIPGQSYTWCLTMRAWGGPSCNGFTAFCPYFLNNAVLPIELSSFTVKYVNNYNYVEWVTETEINNDYFRLERSYDGENWVVLDKINGIGTTQVQQKYNYIDRGFENEINYYKLTQIDFDGTEYNKGIISVDNRKEKKEIIGIYNALGQNVTLEFEGMKIIHYSDGSIKKIF
jgi:hypothetical protein